MSEETKTMPVGDVWNEFLDREGVTRNYLADCKDIASILSAADVDICHTKPYEFDSLRL